MKRNWDGSLCFEISDVNVGDVLKVGFGDDVLEIKVEFIHENVKNGVPGISGSIQNWDGLGSGKKWAYLSQIIDRTSSGRTRA